MKLNLTTVGSFVAAFALGGGAAFALDPVVSVNEPANSAGTPGEIKTSYEGRIVSLFEFLGGSAMSWTSQASDAAIDRYTQGQPPPTDRTQVAGDRPQREIGAGGGGLNGTGAFAGQPLVFVAKGGSYDTTPRQTEAIPSLKPSPSSASSLQSGEAYVLVFNPQDAASRGAFSKAQWLISGRSSNEKDPTSITATPPATDRSTSEVKGKDESKDANRPRETRDPNDVTTSPRTDGISPSEAAKRHYSRHPDAAGKQVKVSGKILSRGGIKALELSEIDEVMLPDLHIKPIKP